MSRASNSQLADAKTRLAESFAVQDASDDDDEELNDEAYGDVAKEGASDE